MKRKEDFVLQNIGGENLLVPIGAQVMDLNGLVILNDTAVYIWDLLVKKWESDEMAGAVAEQFEVDLETAQRDVRAFLNEIAEMGLLED